MYKAEPNLDSPIILLIDGKCLLCSGITQFVVKRDKSRRFRFAALQSKAGQELLRAGHLPTDDIDTFVMIRDGRYETKSNAALRVLRELDGWWRVLFLFIAVPRSLRDRIYDYIARNRYGWFGMTDVCKIPPKLLTDRFLENGVHAKRKENILYEK